MCKRVHVGKYIQYANTKKESPVCKFVMSIIDREHTYHQGEKNIISVTAVRSGY